MYIVSACLAGIKCRYDGKSNKNEYIEKLVKEGKAIPVCPEVLGGLSIPRVPCEILSYKKGKRKVVNKEGRDCTEEFFLGAEKTFQIIKATGIKTAILKSKSPSCGSGKIYDGSFKGRLIKGDGITSEVLKSHGITVYAEDEIWRISCKED